MILSPNLTRQSVYMWRDRIFVSTFFRFI